MAEKIKQNDYERNTELLEMQKAIKKNIAKMNTDMIQLLMRESIGGNAGRVSIDGNTFPCGGANGFLDKATGEIDIFENIQNVSEDIRSQDTEFVLRVALDRKFNPFRIVDVVYYSEDNLMESAKRVMNESIHQWNHGRQPDLEGFQ